MGEIPTIIAVTSDRLSEVAELRRPLAHLAYRVCQGPHLYRVGGMTPPRGGLMGIGNTGFSGGGDPSKFCQEVVRECVSRNFRGVVCDFEGGRSGVLERAITQLGEGFSRRNWSLYVPEQYGQCTPHARVMISSALSGGSLRLRLEEAVAQYGKRVVLAVERLSEDFLLPSLSGGGTPLSAEELASLQERLSPSVFYSADLCARYFTYMGQDGGVHFVLFDDRETTARKIQLAEELGLVAVVMAWAEIGGWGLIAP